MTASGSGTLNGFASPAVISTPSLLPGERRGRPLSQRELRIMAAYARTGGQREAAAELGLAHKTVKNGCGYVYAKLGVFGVINAFRELGWLNVPEDVAA